MINIQELFRRMAREARAFSKALKRAKSSGRIVEIAMWNRVLDASEIAKIQRRK